MDTKLFKKHNKPIFSFLQRHQKKNVSKYYCIAYHEDKMWFLPICGSHIILMGDNKELLQTVDVFNTCTVCMRFSSADSVSKMLSRVDNSLISCRRQLLSTTKTVERTESAASRKDDSWGKSKKKYSLSSYQKTKSTPTSWAVFADRIEQVRKTKYELELIKFVYYVLHGHGNCTSRLVSFKIIFSRTIDFLNYKGICIIQLVMQML